MLSINLDGLEDNVKPAMKNTMKYLQRAQDIFYSMTIPSDFSYASTLRSMPGTISNIHNRVNTNENWIENTISNFSETENNNSNLLNSISSLLDGLNISEMLNNTATIRKKQEESDPIGDFLNFLSDTWDAAGQAVIDFGNFLMDAGEVATQTASNIGNDFLSFLSGAWDTACNWGENVANFFTNDVPTAINELGGKISDVWNYLCENTILGDIIDFGECFIASAVNTLGAITKGLSGLVESLFDVVAVLGTVSLTIPTGILDGITYLGSLITGNNDSWDSITAGMWSNTMSFVAEDHVSNAYKDFYENNMIGQWLDEHAHDWFKSDGSVTGLISGASYVVGIIALSYFTFGIAGLVAGGSTAISAGGLTGIASLIAGLAGAGEGTEYIWGQKRDSSMEGIERMLENGEISQEQYDSIIMIRQMTDEQWEEIELDYKNGNISKEQYDLMHEIREIPEDWKNFENLISGMGYGATIGIWEGIQWYLGGKLVGWSIPGRQGLTSATRIGIDSLFNTADTPFRALIESLTTGEDINKTFENQGGIQSLLMNFGIGFLGSFGGEIYDAHKINQNNTTITNRLNRLNSLEGIDELTSNRIREILESQSNNKKIDINNMTDVQLNQYVLELLNNRNSQIDDVAKYLYGNQSGEISDQVKLKIANGVDVINRTGLLDNMDEAKANMIRNQIIEDYFSNNIDLDNINEGQLQNSIKRYGEIYEKINASKESFSELINRGYIEENKLNELINEHIFIKDKDEFEILYKQYGGKENPENVNAFYYNGNVYLRESNNITTITHELNHALGRMFFYDKYTGVLFYHRGLNEALTEKIAIDLTNGPNASGYYFNVNMINNLMEVIKKAGYDDVDLNAYFGNASSSYKMKEIVDNIAEQDGTFDRIAELMDIADGCDSRYTPQEVQMAKIELVSIMEELYKKVGIL